MMQRSQTEQPFLKKYGPWALVAGASSGLGLAYSKELARRGLNVVLVAEEESELWNANKTVAAVSPVQTKWIVADLSQEESLETIAAQTKSLDIGLLIYNATYHNLGAFLDKPLDDHIGVVNVNCKSPVALSHLLATRMKNRSRSGIVLMASLTAFMGTPFVSTYGASKSFALSLAEALSFELSPLGIDVLASAPGAVATPNYLNSVPKGVKSPAPLLHPDTVVCQTLNQLGKRTVFIPGFKNKSLAFLLGRLLPRTIATKIMGSATRKLYGQRAQK